MKPVLKNTLIAFALALVGCSDSPRQAPQAPAQTEAGYVTDEFFPAIQENDLAKIKELIASGADVNFNYIGPFEWTPLEHAACLDAAEIVRVLIDAGADVHGTSKDEGTALIMASLVGNYEITKMLIDAGSDVNWANLAGRTALHWAKTVEIAQLLIDNGADVNLKDGQGVTALLVLALDPRPSQSIPDRTRHANLLREHGADQWELFLRLKTW